MSDGLGLVQVYTGNGKGKTTAAIGLTVRAVGRGLKVLFVQFLKPEAGYGEQVVLDKLDGVERMCFGLPHWVSKKPSEEDKMEARAGLEKVSAMMQSGEYDMVVMDEINNALRLNVLTSEEVLDVLRSRPAGVEVVMTGRGATPEIIEYADLVTEMTLVKHPFDKGVDARKGIEY